MYKPQQYTSFDLRGRDTCIYNQRVDGSYLGSSLALDRRALSVSPRQAGQRERNKA